MKKFVSLIAIIVAFYSYSSKAERLKDLVSFVGVTNQLVGYGIVVGLDGTGDSASQSMAYTISRLSLKVNSADISAKNVAEVMVTAVLKPFTKIGQTINVTVSSMGKAKSLRGGTLLMTPLRGAGGQVYAIAQGNLAVGGFGVEGKDGSPLSVNIPTVGSIANGATVKKMAEPPFIKNNNIIMNLHQGDFATANRIAEEINKIFGPGVSRALDGTSISVNAPKGLSQKISFMSLLENIEVKPYNPIPKVVVNKRTGIIIIGGDVRIKPTVISHKNLKIEIKENDCVISTPKKVNKVYASLINERCSTRKLSDIVDALNLIGINTEDLLAILKALRESGALKAQMIFI